ncbi:hypothetical protein PFLmoz3_05716 [Pseudomonas fluorescens]|uniref:Uncharacterized protein n=1 Tax=Pseudomonas fluorescens TaxID=294 RepID=A0A109LBU5_PSEFL|nr:hypothetical protein PFLmoz3_05716 [Pseudomonas fluorescens]
MVGPAWARDARSGARNDTARTSGCSRDWVAIRSSRSVSLWPMAGATSGANCSAIISPRCSSWVCNSDSCIQVK